MNDGARWLFCWGTLTAALGLAACGSGGDGSPGPAGTLDRSAATLVGNVLGGTGGVAARVAGATGSCPDVALEVEGQPITVVFDDNCRVFITEIPAGDVSVSVAVEGVESDVRLLDVAADEVVEVEIEAVDSGLSIDVFRWAEEDPAGGLLPAVVRDDGVALELPPGEFDQSLTVRGDGFRLTGTAGDRCDGGGWSTVTGPAVFRGDGAVVAGIRFLGPVTVRGDGVRFDRVCFESPVLVAGESEPPVDDLGEPVACSAEVQVAFGNLGLEAGDSVEGEGLLAPDLVVESEGELVLIREGSEPVAYRAGEEDGVNGCLGGDGAGFADLAEERFHDTVFHFAPGRTVQEFALRVVDLGDEFTGACPDGEDAVRLVAYDVDDTVVASAAVPCADLAGIQGDPARGDACAAAEGDPGNRVLRVEGSRIARVVLEFPAEGVDPSVGFDQVSFLPEIAVEVLPTLNLKSRGVIPVAVLGDACFDPGGLDPETVRFGPAAASLAHPGGHGGSAPGADRNGDGWEDRVFHFRTQETGIEPDQAAACLSAEGFEELDGETRTWQGCDELRFAPGSRR